MQAYGWSMGITQYTNVKIIKVIFPVMNADLLGPLKNFKDSLYRDGEIFQRVRLFPERSILETPTTVTLFSGSYCEITSRAVTKIIVCGNVVINILCRKGMRAISVTEYKIDCIDDITSPSLGKWLVYRKDGSCYDSATVPFTEASADKALSELVGSLQPPTYAQTWSVWRIYNELEFQYFPDYSYSGALTDQAFRINMDLESLIVFDTLSTRERQSCAQAAYVSAAEGIPQVTSNSFANVLDLAGILSSLLRKDAKHATSLIKNAWLAYRYAVCTTVSDVREYADYADRIVALADIAMPSTFKCHGSFTTRDGWKYHCVLVLETGVAFPEDAKETLKSFGFALNAVNSWDMVPYSFIVDWFIPVSDILENIENQYSSKDIPVKECWMSVTSPNGDCYLRFPYVWNSAIPQIRQKDVSSKTLWMRIADTIALLK